MTLIQFIRLLQTHRRFLLIAPIIPALVVFVLTLRQPKEFTSTSVVYTALTSPQPLNGSEARTDLFAVNSSFDNLMGLINSRQVLERTGLRLMARQLSATAEHPSGFDEAAYRHAFIILSEDFRHLVSVTGLEDSTYQLILANRDNTSLQELLASEEDPFSPLYIGKHLKVKRSGVSDMLEISYTSNSPEISRATLSILTDIFLSEYKLLKIQQAGNLVKFFESEVDKSNARLRGISDDLKDFRIKNRIINYDEQTKQITVEDVYIGTEYREELRKLAGAEAALGEVNTKLGVRADQLVNNKNVIERGNRLKALTNELVRAEATGSDSSSISQLKQESNRIREELRSSISGLYDAEYTKEGLSSKSLVEQWLIQYLAVTEEKARVELMKERQTAFQHQFDQFAPLGSALHNYDREIDVSEREYLELLRSLNVARLYQQNLEATSNIRIVDPPNLPRNAEASKRILLIVLGWFAGLILSSGGIVALEYLDRSLRTPQRAELLTGLGVAGAIPDLSGPEAESVSGGLRLGIEQIIQAIKLNLSIGSTASSPKVIAVCSINPQDGKTLLAEYLANRLSELGHSTRLLVPHAIGGLTVQTDSIEYAIPENFYDVSSVNELLPGAGHFIGTEFVILEIPSLLQSAVPLRLLQRVDLAFIIIRADKVWGKAETKTVQIFTKLGKSLPDLILSGVKDDRMEDIVGELPKKRSTLRKLFKRVARMEFRS